MTKRRRLPDDLPDKDAPVMRPPPLKYEAPPRNTIMPRRGAVYVETDDEGSWIGVYRTLCTFDFADALRQFATDKSGPPHPTFRRWLIDRGYIEEIPVEYEVREMDDPTMVDVSKILPHD